MKLRGDITKTFGEYKVTLSSSSLTVGCQNYKLSALPKLIAAARDLIKRLPKPLKIDGDTISDVDADYGAFNLNGKSVRLPDEQHYSLLKPAVRKYLTSYDETSGSNRVFGVDIEIIKDDGGKYLSFEGESIAIDDFEKLAKWVESETRKRTPKKKATK